MTHPQDESRSWDDTLRHVMDDRGAHPSFDYEALVAGTHQRARRIRRRRTLAQAATLAVLVPALAGAGWLASSRLGGLPEQQQVASPTTPTVPQPAGATTTPTEGRAARSQVAASTVSPTDLPQPTTEGAPVATVTTTTTATASSSAPEASTQPAPSTAASTAGGPAGTTAPTQRTVPTEPAATPSTEPTTPSGPTTPPYQDPALLTYPLLGTDTSGAANAFEVPDARPTGVPALDRFGIPAQDNLTSTLTPALDATASQGETGASPVAGRQFLYQDGSTELTITLTAWQDAPAAFRSLTTNGTELTSTWLGPDGQPWAPPATPWPGHETDPERILVIQDAWLPAADGSTTTNRVAVAMIRQGDYLVAVSEMLPAGHDSTALTTVSTLADRTAANLEALDPVHGRG